MLLTLIFMTRAGFWAKLTVKTSIDWNEQDCWVLSLSTISDTLNYILKNTFISTIKGQCSDKGKRTWRGWNQCKNRVIDVLCPGEWLHNADMPGAEWASTERQPFVVLQVRLLKCELDLVIYNRCIGHLYKQKCMLHSPHPILTISSVSSGSGPSHRVRVQVQTKPLPRWWSGLSMDLNIQIGYGWLVYSQPFCIWRDVIS